MSRKTAHMEAARTGGSLPGRRGVWAAIRELGTFTKPQLRLAAQHVNQHVVEVYLKALIRNGRIRAGAMVPACGAGNRKYRQYTLIRDTGVDAPRLRSNGVEMPPSGQQLMWEAMRMLGDFTASSLAANASTDEVSIPAGTAGTYIRHLQLSGYIGSRSCGNVCVYRVVNDTGGLAPIIQQTKVVFDPNLNRVMWHEDIEP